jgi:uncharacterized protein
MGKPFTGPKSGPAQAISHTGHSFGDVEFYIERLHALGSRIVLEPAAGNDRVLIPLAQAGFRMTGFDRSPHMLDYLHKNCARWTVSASIFEDSLEGFDLGARFDAVILPAGSLQLLDNPASASDFLRRCRLPPRSGGHLLFDPDAASAFEPPQPSSRRWRLEDGGEITLTETVTSCQPATQRVEYSHRYDHLRDGRPVSSEVEAAGSVQTLLAALRRAGGHSMRRPALTLIYIDADACPVRSEAVRVAERHGLEVAVVSNGGIRPNPDPRVRTVIVPEGPDAADRWIAERIGLGDICVTADTVLAARCLEAGAQAIRPSGEAFTAANIGNAMAMRDLMADLRAANPLGAGGGNRPFGRADRSHFLDGLERMVRAAARESPGA